MANEAIDKKGRLGKNLFAVGAILAAFLGGPLALVGCCLSAGWLAALARGASAAELPDPTAMIYPIVLLPSGIVLLLLAGLLLAASRWWYNKKNRGHF